MNQSTTILASKSILNTKELKVREVTLRLKNEKKITHYNAEARPEVFILPITEKNELYLISEYRYLLEKETLGIIGGSVEKDEKPLFAAKKELKEEAGITAEQWEELSRIELARSYFRQQMHLFLAKNIQIGQQDVNQDETIKVIKLSIDEAVKKIFTGEINHSISMLGILILDKLKREKKL